MMTFHVQDVTLAVPPLFLVRCVVAAVWLYEGLWCKILGRAPSQRQVVESVPKLGPSVGGAFLKILGLVETSIAVWVISGLEPGICAISQTALLVVLNTNGLLWARHIIHDPAGMVVKNIAFLVLAWVCGAMGAPR
ncbi:MAG TPA: DoxX-like family protein [Blastocatellia bacterium]|nr:DoxX-like family protein [Blastocatellia bacterium]